MIYSTNEAARKLGITGAALSKYIKAGKFPTPKAVQTGMRTVHLWSEEEVEELRQLLPKIKNGRKTRYKKQSAKRTTKQRSAQPRVASPRHAQKRRTSGAPNAVPHKQRSTKKKSKP